jgi:hypothetical protein
MHLFIYYLMTPPVFHTIKRQITELLREEVLETMRKHQSCLNIRDCRCLTEGTEGTPRKPQAEFQVFGPRFQAGTF